MMHVELIKEWLNGLSSDDEVGIDEGGLMLMTKDGQNWLEVGGLPLPDEGSGAPPYDAATATGMYDRDEG